MLSEGQISSTGAVFFFDIAWKPLALNTVLIEKALSSDPNSNSLEGLTLGIVQQ